MRPHVILNILLLLSAACAPAACIMLPSPARWWCAGIAAMSFILLLLLRRSIVKPLSAAQRGLELLRAQDFNNRLIKVGEPGADRIVSLFNDLMTRLKNERLRLKEQDTFLRLLIEASPMGIILLNLDGRVSMTNGAFIRIAEIRNEDGIAGKRLDAEKEAYEKVIRMISHEVNNTMGSVLTVLETLAEDTAGDPDLNETIESCRERCAGMCGFIDSFAELARIPDPVLRQVDMNAEITGMLPFLRLMATDSCVITFNNENRPLPEIEKERMYVNADMPLLQQAIVNIVKNAVESISGNGNRDGVIHIATENENGSVTLTICNNGAEISEETASRLFSPFFSTKHSGRGLGLTVVSEVLRRHGCSFSLRTGQDSLTRFTIRFPGQREVKRRPAENAGKK
ncbi:MAG: HAMP domain-containing histidine kinase [Muribaculaceae bacterium]|nr:HAMP domain-containing histidine kinase [Muribaculaceae bacterium]